MPQEIYIDVESHEMVDVDVKSNRPYVAGGGFVPDQKMTPISDKETVHTAGSD